MRVDPKETRTSIFHTLMLGAVAPRPIAFASTIDKEGNPNLSPFSFFNVFSAKPPIAIFSPSRRGRDNTTKDTFHNVLEVNEVVINVVSYDMVEQMNLSSVEYPSNVNEFVKAGFTPIESEMVKPFRVAESPVQLECKVKQVIPLSNRGGAGNLVICEIVLMHVNDDILDAAGKIDPQKIDLVGRMGGNAYCRASGDAVFEVRKPGTAIAIGLNQLPDFILNSEVLTGNDLGKLAMVEEIPNETVVENFRQTDRVKSLFETYQHDKSELEKQIHKNAHQMLEAGKTEEAWKLLLTLQ